MASLRKGKGHTRQKAQDLLIQVNQKGMAYVGNVNSLAEQVQLPCMTSALLRQHSLRFAPGELHQARSLQHVPG